MGDLYCNLEEIFKIKVKGSMIFLEAKPFNARGARVSQGAQRGEENEKFRQDYKINRMLWLGKHTATSPAFCHKYVMG